MRPMAIPRRRVGPGGRAARASRSCAGRLRRHERLYYVENRPEITDAEFDRLMRELLELEDAHPELAQRRLAERGASGASPPRASRPSSTSSPMLSLENAYSWEEARGVARARHAAARPRAPRLRRRAQDRRPVDRPPVRKRGARARGDARRRDARRGRHRERPHDPHDAAAHRRRVAARGPGRGLLLEEGVREGQRGAGGRGRAALRQPAQRRRGNDAPARLAHHGAATPRRLALRRRRGDAHAAPTQSDAARPARGAGVPGQPSSRRCESFEDVRRFVEDWREKRHELGFETDGVVIKVDDRALQQDARLDRQVAALGARLQVPGRGGDDGGPRDRLNVGPHRGPDAGGALRPGSTRRHHGQEGHAPQLRGPGAQGRAGRRHGRRRERRRRHSEGRPGRAREAARRLAAFRHARRTVRSAATPSCARKARWCRAASTRPARPSCGRPCGTSAAGAP